MKENKTYLLHIIEAIEKVNEYTKSETYESFLKNDLVFDAVMRKLEVIGEASCNVSEDFQEQNSQIPWGKMIGMRNKLIHEYFGVDKKVVWKTCKDDLPELKKLIEAVI